jgi:glucose-6-phosphate-specific signal transduction histidine kinase
MDRTREALANVQKHAAPCRVSVRVERDDRRVEVSVADDGCGGADAHGAGLRGLADRIDELWRLPRRLPAPRAAGPAWGAEIPPG